MNQLSELQSVFSGTLVENEPLKNYTSFRIGGPAEYFAVVKSIDELRTLTAKARELSLPIFILAGGSNIIVTDDGLPGLVIKTAMDQFMIEGTTLRCDAGAYLSKAVFDSARAGLQGLEWAAGIPGLIGGAIYGNAGAYGGSMADSIATVTVLRDGELIEIPKSQCDFKYRHSIFKHNDNHDIIVSCVIELVPGNSAELLEKIKATIKERNQKMGACYCAGCFFKNIELPAEAMAQFKSVHPDLPDRFVEFKKIPVGWLIENCGLKDYRIGDAVVSNRHAAIITNQGDATAAQVRELVDYIKQQVRQRFGFELTEEVQYIGF